MSHSIISDAIYDLSKYLKKYVDITLRIVFGVKTYERMYTKYKR
jgi:hypothetical protein